MTLEEWADMLDAAVRERTGTRSIIVLPDDLARQLAEHLRAAAYLLEQESTTPEQDEN